MKQDSEDNKLIDSLSANANGMFSEPTDVDMGNKSLIKYTLGCTGQSQVMTRQKMEPKCTSSES